MSGFDTRNHLTALQVQAFQRFERGLDLVAIAARLCRKRQTRFSVPYADHQRRHETAAALVTAPQPLAVDRHHASGGRKPEPRAQGFGKPGEELGQFLRIEQAEQPGETVVARRAMRQIDNPPKLFLMGRREIGNVHAGLRAAQHRNQGDEQHGRTIVPRIHVARIVNLTQNGKQHSHRSLPRSGRFLKNPVRNDAQCLCQYLYAIPLLSALALRHFPSPSSSGSMKLRWSSRPDNGIHIASHFDLKHRRFY